MSRDDVELVRRVREAWRRLTVEQIAVYYAADAEIVSAASELIGGTYEGPEGLRRYIGAFLEAFESPTFELEELVGVGERVVEVGRLRTRGRRSGVDVQQRITCVYSIRDGLIAKHEIYLDRAKALRLTRSSVRPAAHQLGPGVVETRAADPTDAASLTATVADALEGYRAWAPAEWSAPQEGPHATRRLAKALSEVGVWCLVAESKGDPVGHVALSPTTRVQPEAAPPGTVNLWQLFVRRAWQGSGIAAILLGAAVTEAERRGFARVRLWTPSGAVRARCFYEREGWALTGNRHEQSPLGLPIVEYARDVPQRWR